MKKQILAIALMGLFTITACTDKKQGEVPDQETPATGEVDKTGTAADSAVKADTLATRPKEGDIITVTGKVTEINRGKDGYSAKIKTVEDKVYIGTISIPNMADPKDYRSVKEGETITVTGVVFPVEEDVMIKVTKLH